MLNAGSQHHTVKLPPDVLEESEVSAASAVSSVVASAESSVVAESFVVVVSSLEDPHPANIDAVIAPTNKSDITFLFILHPPKI
jgi:hypothetical protein